MNRIGDDLLLDALKQREDYIHEAANAIDTKAGMVLAAAAFLAVQPAVLLVAPNVSKCTFLAQLVSCVALSVAVWFAHKVLSVQGYPSPGFSESWRDDTIADAPTGSKEEDVRATILWGLIEQAKQRIADGIALNDRKLNQLAWARRGTTTSLAINLCILIAILLTHLS